MKRKLRKENDEKMRKDGLNEKSDKPARVAHPIMRRRRAMCSEKKLV